MATATLTPIMEEIRNAEFFSILLDETADVASVEQVSICLRYVTEDLNASEYFVGFFSTPDTKSQTLFNLVNAVLAQYKLPLSKLRGQCYDGASNVSGKISGLQKRIREEEPRALFVHCNAHNLNLVVQDSLQKINIARKFIGIIKNLINFVRDSPKRLDQFKQFQNETDQKKDILLPSLAAYCPTRWVLRVKSLKAVRANYAVLLTFFLCQSTNKEIDTSVSAKALGFFEFMASFECFFMLTMIIEIFNRIEILNTELQKSNLSVIDSYKK